MIKVRTGRIVDTTRRSTGRRRQVGNHQKPTTGREPSTDRRNRNLNISKALLKS